MFFHAKVSGLQLSANDRQSEPHRRTPQEPDPCTPGNRDDGDGVEDGGAHLVRLLHVELLHLFAHIEPFAGQSHGERVRTDGMGDGQVEEGSRDREGGGGQGEWFKRELFARTQIDLTVAGL